jgi:hypothetical protein
MGLIETLFSQHIVRMGPSRSDPARQVATFDPKTIGSFAAVRESEMNTFRWLVGEWTYQNPVPATPVSPAYCDLGSALFAESADGASICSVGHDGRQTPLLAFDPWSRRWMYMLTKGSYGILRSPGWRGHQITFVGTLTMIGIDCEWKMTWTRDDDDEFVFVNEEKLADGSWSYIDEWRYRRKRSPEDRKAD